MDITQSEFKQSLKNIVTHFPTTSNYNELIDGEFKATLPELVKMIICDLFIYNIAIDESQFNSDIELARKYCEEINLNGYVTFQ